MQTVSISTILSQEIAFLPLIQQQQVLDYVRQLKETVHNPTITSQITEATTSKTTHKTLPTYISRPPAKVADLEKFVGMFSKEDLEIMSQVIEENCGRVDFEDW